MKRLDRFSSMIRFDAAFIQFLWGLPPKILRQERERRLGQLILHHYIYTNSHNPVISKIDTYLPTWDNTYIPIGCLSIPTYLPVYSLTI
jgi:hypothetical protein